MVSIKFLAVLCFAAMAVLPMGNGQTVCKPAIHLAGTTPKNVDFSPNQVLDKWSTSGEDGVITGGMVYADGQITVPVSGLYFVYCQVFYNDVNPAAQHQIIVNNNRLVALANYSSRENFGGTKYAGLIVKLNQGDKIVCKVGPHPVTVWAGPSYTFFGAYGI